MPAQADPFLRQTLPQGLRYAEEFLEADEEQELVAHIRALPFEEARYKQWVAKRRWNRWRASRYGLDGKMVDFGKMAEVPTRQLVRELLDLISEEVDELGIRPYLQPIEQMLMHGTSADRQLRIFDSTDGDLKAVVDHLLAETAMGLDL